MDGQRTWVEVERLVQQLKAEGEARLRQELVVPHLVDLRGTAGRADGTPLACPVCPGPMRAGPDTPCLTLGRSPRNDLVLDDPSVSRFHAYLLQQEDGWCVYDADSHNGTWLNGQRVQAGLAGRGVPLADLALLRLGAVELLFLLPGSFVEYLDGWAAPE